MLVLNLPLPPSVNHYWGTHGHRRYVSKAGVMFKEQVSDYVAEFQVPKLGAARLEMQVTLYPKDRRKQDIDNRIKALWDALADAGVFDNDEQIDVLLHRRPGGDLLRQLIVRTLRLRHKNRCIAP